MDLYPVEKSVISLNSLLEVDDLSSTTTFLDWGGNQGNLLSFDNFPIKQSNYTCVDVDKGALDVGAKNYPDANFFHYNKYNKVYNQTGNLDEPFPSINTKQDIIFAFSVFTHTDFNEFKQTVRWMKETFTYKKIIISLIGTNSTKLLDRFYKARVERDGSSIDIRNLENETDTNIAYLTDNNVLIRDQIQANNTPCQTFLTMYRPPFVLGHLGGTIQIVHELEYPFLVIEP